MEERWDVIGAVEDLVEEFVCELVGVLDLFVFDFLEEGFVHLSLDVWMEKEEMMGGWDVLVFVGENCAFLFGSFAGFVVVERGGGVVIDALEDGCDGLG